MSYGIGRYASGEGDVVFFPPRRQRQVRPPVIYCHPSGGSAAGIAAKPDSGEARLLAGIARAGFLVVAPDLGGASHTWGNDLAAARIAQARLYAEQHWHARPGRVLLVGTSMGALDMLGFVRVHPGAACGLVGVAPVSDLGRLRALGADDLQARIEAAWCVSAGSPLPEEAEPLNLARQSPVPPYLAFYASDDPLLPADSVVRLAEALGGRAVDLGPVGHAAAVDAVPVSDVVKFLQRAG